MARLSPAYRLLPWLLPKIPVGVRENLISQSRWLVIDCESSGLDPRRDKLLEVACVAVDGTKIKLADSYEGLIHQAEASSVANILIHGISGQRQRSGSLADGWWSAFTPISTENYAAAPCNASPCGAFKAVG
jgi:DNA polymerase III epsilon subunit-like protein